MDNEKNYQQQYPRGGGGSSYSGGARRNDYEGIETNFKNDWITKGFDKSTIEYAETVGAKLTKMTTSQIRNYFGEVRRIQMKGIKDEMQSFLLLKPKLAYLAQRSDNDATKAFRKIMDKAYEAVDINSNTMQKHFQNYVDLLEAILAYHKAAGGK